MSEECLSNKPLWCAVLTVQRMTRTANINASSIPGANFCLTNLKVWCVENPPVGILKGSYLGSTGRHSSSEL